ncbi:hypothetical protein CY35_17G001000 [Sphagnum magellanicum]|nr:hypothetical protein CY35_17G001000 [Sphagnum magellanicum]
MREERAGAEWATPAQPPLLHNLYNGLGAGGLSFTALNTHHVGGQQERLTSVERLRRFLGSSREDSGSMEMKEVPSKSIDMKERAVSAAGAAFISAVIVNPLDVAKTRLQAQAAGVNYQQQVACLMELPTSSKVAVDGRCPPACPRNSNVGVAPACPPLGASQYKGTWDVVYKIARQEGLFRLWTGLNPALAIAIPTVGIYLPCYDFLLESIGAYSDNHMLNLRPYAPLAAGSIARSLACIICSPVELARTRMQAQKEVRGGTPPGIMSVLHNAFSTTEGLQGGSLQRVRMLWAGVGAQLARDVPFSAICWTTLEPVRHHLLEVAGPEPNVCSVLGANFAAGVLAGGLAAAATCPLDVAKTRRQIEKDPVKAMRMTTYQTLLDVWRKQGVRGLFMGVGPRVGRAGPSTAIVVSFYEVVKYVLHKT